MSVLSNLLSPTVPLDIPFARDTVKLGYRPDFLTPEVEEIALGFEHIAENEAKSPKVGAMLLNLVEWWDLKEQDTDPDPIPLTLEGLKKVPLEIQNHIIGEIFKASSTGNSTEPNSDAT